MGAVEQRLPGPLSGVHLAALVGILLMPLLFGTFMAIEIVIFCIFALGYNVLLGYGGEMSFGHAAYFGAGAYGTVLAAQHLVANLYVSMLVGMLIALALSVIFGLVSLRRRGIYFGMITLALAQMIYFVVFQLTGLTGGSNGISLPDVSASLVVLDPGENTLHFYVFALVIAVLVWLGIRRVVNSRYGRALIAIRESEERARHLGYEINHFLLISFVMSGLVSGLAGALYAGLFNFISPNLLFWSLSGEIVLIVIIGGVGTLAGPVIGASVFVILNDVLTDLTSDWQIIFGAVVMAVVVFAPQGLYGIYQSYVDPQAKTPRSIGELLKNLRPGSD